MTITPVPIPRFPLLVLQTQQHLFSSQPLPQSRCLPLLHAHPLCNHLQSCSLVPPCLPTAPSAKGEGFADGAWPSPLVLFLLQQTIRIHQGGKPQVSENFQDFLHQALHLTASSLWTSSQSQAIRAFLTASTVLLLSSQCLRACK